MKKLFLQTFGWPFRNELTLFTRRNHSVSGSGRKFDGNAEKGLIGKTIFTAACFICFSGFVNASDYKWYVVNESLNEGNKSLHIGEAPQKIKLKGGWSCEIGATSIINSRQTICQSGDKVIEFSVQCESNHPKDRAQVRFKNLDGKYVDFIEVGCEQV